MKEIFLNMESWRAEITIPDSPNWSLIFRQIVELSGVSSHRFLVKIPTSHDFLTREDARGIPLDLDDGDTIHVKFMRRVVPLCEAARNGNPGAIRRWLAAGVDVDELRGDFTPLMEASMLTHVRCVEELLLVGADASYVNRFGMTALHCVVQYPEGFTLLTNSYHDPECVHEEDTPSQVIRLLIEAGCDPNVRDSEGHTFVEKMRSSNYSDYHKRQFEKWIADALDQVE